jgi:hypothetical protein
MFQSGKAGLSANKGTLFATTVIVAILAIPLHHSNRTSIEKTSVAPRNGAGHDWNSVESPLDIPHEDAGIPLLPQGIALMIPGSFWMPAGSGAYASKSPAGSTSAMAAGLPPANQLAYRAEVAKRIASARGGGGGSGGGGGGGSSEVHTAGIDNRITQAEIDAMKAGVDFVFTDLENALVAVVFGEKLPLIGDGFQTAWINNTDSFRLLTEIRLAIVNGLNSFTGSPDYDPLRSPPRSPPSLFPSRRRASLQRLPTTARALISPPSAATRRVPCRLVPTSVFPRWTSN